MAHAPALANRQEDVRGTGSAADARDWRDRRTLDVLPFWVRFEFDAGVFAYVAAVCVVTALLFGLAPAWQLAQESAHDAMKGERRRPRHDPPHAALGGRTADRRTGA